MAQKYKIFVKTGAVVMVENSAISDPQEGINEQILNAIRNGVIGDKTFEVTDADRSMRFLEGRLKLIIAGGGVVTQEEGKLLMIHRRGFWDLPKGKAEQDETIEETALREVEEECGIDGLTITSGRFDTHHVYEEKGELVLKRSVWFRMSTEDQSLVPQIEEDIERAEWVEVPVNTEITQNAYPSIREVLLHFNLAG